MPSKKGPILFWSNQIPAPMHVDVYTFAPSRINQRYTFLLCLKSTLETRAEEHVIG